VQTISINDGMKKAAAEGAALWYLKQTVVARASRSHFGVASHPKFDSADPLPLQRPHAKYNDFAGDVCICAIFNIWCKKVL
jgi:hypothetical protein